MSANCYGCREGWPYSKTHPQQREIEEAHEYLTSLGIWRGHNLTYRIREALRQAAERDAAITTLAEGTFALAREAAAGIWQLEIGKPPEDAQEKADFERYTGIILGAIRAALAGQGVSPAAPGPHTSLSEE
jgi:hypothetical protein